MEFIIVTGMSGAGKSQAIDLLEDIGFYCVDNVPPKLLAKFAELSMQPGSNIQRIALVVDVRSKSMFADLFMGLEELRRNDYRYHILFLDAADDVLIRRYKETRRKHPLISEEISSMPEAIRVERDMLKRVKEMADYVIDTSLLSATQLKKWISGLFVKEQGRAMSVDCLSFGFKYGLPVDADLVFDVRCLPNPFYLPELKELTGLDDAVREYVLGFEQARGLASRLLDLVDYLIPLYVEEGKSRLVIAMGCTGGKHRSVVFAELLSEYLKESAIPVTVNHRDMRK